MTQITISELPQTLQTLINEAKKTGEPLTITENGIPLAIISPIKKKSLLEVFANLEDIDEEFPNVDEGLLPLDEIEL
ncbi:type II toxin-antitoxin system Phd/YefM family antitoxin [Dolichospermum sp. UHCC 0684]|jgi:antitoxin VapB|uniref:type II toxin-antitoxin system Phd/YefM family antitoxin n=1 Tax=Nostocales TaxID=1161 RepID=UPI00029B7B1A|nr:MULTISPECIES: type II toxin-antitoxin system Phd/YefM family antitoxin [Nostocales]MBJ7298529.1 type II toxin-antitoxin system Phd/YefM family antitoxin [Dolichospermum sp.]AFW94978.1 prevent-host-death family protein [Anabaena sp. 90]MEA5531295.1 type II toxin-antitoxin system Phd/YefM family antitoxin [Dolichospermum sp. UHCC 0684]MTJ22030.1 type II toxin-antitoxin system Phd/YefM family antitoxin [Dolichospermum sp. UHCC 0352]MTJ34383.1 type II toxin-antitoxin system Phd/YefM family anti